MKRMFSILLALCLVGCGLTYPTGLDKKSYEEGKKALEVMDNYNGGDLETDITETKLKSINARIEVIEDTDDNWRKSMIQIDIIEFIYEMGEGGDTKAIADKLRDILED